ncbi:hypothetical protein PENSOL_c001G01279 [Penicillium solitum]|uniref:Ig-like domain-containing protein n=1 Tax=Penicillium solitum TaxID=60172 RepID=A0A1V6RNX1_9EURO|nr:uncharacterized protein PENSOL_c001G01279 [Penicillium solitum]OQE03477.1 hypothetical protein PENSOL_c001G01279 [Penicillium solitum]
MGSFLVRGWIVAALLLQTIATTLIAEPTVTPTPTAVATHHNQHHHKHHHHHHWSYVSRPLPSRKPCPVRSSSAVLASSVIPTSTPLLSVVPSHSPRPHWSHTPRPHSSSVAIQTPSAPVSTPVTNPSIVVSAPGSISTGPSQLSGSPGVTTGLGSSTSQVSISASASDDSTTLAASIPTSAQSGALQSGVVSGSSTLELTTSMVFSTRTATITACPTTVPNCPASSKTTFVTTETILVSTTICPVTETAGPTETAAASLPATGGAGDYSHGNGGLDFTISTVYSTRTATITACPSSVTNCPLRSKTTYLTTETLIVSTTVCPVADATGVNGAVPTKNTTPPSTTEAIGGGENGASKLTTSTIFATRTAIVFACPESVTDCPLRSKTSYATTETFAVATTVFPVYPVHTSVPAEGVEKDTVPVIVANPQATGVSLGSQSGSESAGSGSDSGAGLVQTTTIVVESCSDDDTCTGYINTIVVTQTNAAKPTAAPSIDTPHRGSGVGASGSFSASSTHSWFPSSHSSGMATATVSTATGAVSPVYTGAASGATRSSMMQIVGSMVVILLAICI